MEATKVPTNDGSSSSSDASLVDPISELPESLISHILSSMPTKDAVATSILSRSWRFRWNKVTSFRFEKIGRSSVNQIRGDVANFEDFVNLVLHNSSGDSINEFDLYWYSPNLSPVSVYRWANIAVARKVRVLDLFVNDLDRTFELQLPLSLYTSGNLEVLRLNGRFRVKPSNVVCLPRLTELDLSCVIYDSDESFHWFISGCPVLESLKMTRETLKENPVVCSISSPVLKHLSILFTWDDNDWDDDEWLLWDDDDLKLKLKIDAPALEFLSLIDYMSRHISIQPRLSSVKEVRFQAPFCAGFSELSQAFDSVEILTLHSTLNEGVNWSVAFKKLVRLAIHSDYRPQWSCLMDLLGGCNNLEELQICCGVAEDDYGNSWRNPARVPSCLVSSLTKLTLLDFDGLKDEMAMLKFFLDHSLVMETVYICHDERANIDYIWHDERANIDYVKIRNQVSELSKASPTCEISWLEGDSDDYKDDYVMYRNVMISED